MVSLPRIPIILAAIICLLSLLSCEKAPPPKPNFVFFLVDDWGWTDAACFGSSFYETPNIDRLAAEGMRFTNAYAACPVCSPTRASIMTGKYPARLGITDWIPGRQSYRPVEAANQRIARPFRQELPLEETTIAEALKSSGYKTFFAGKWHLGGEGFWPENQGFDINKGGHEKGSPPGGYFSPYKNPRLDNGPEGENLTDRLANESMAFLETAGEQPFLLYLSFYTVHTPLQTWDTLEKKYEAKKTALNYVDSLRLTDEPWMEKAREGNYKTRLVHDHPKYAGMVETLDYNIGRVMAKLKEKGLDKNTVIILMSDNGGLATAEGSPTSNLPLRAGKGWLYEGGIREPMIIKWPGVTQGGSVADQPVISTDFYPTMLEMAGIPLNPDQHPDGESLVPLLRGTGSPERDAIFWHYHHYANQGGFPGGVVRKGKYKLIQSYEDMHTELYDLESDPGEQTDISQSNPETTRELTALLESWRQSVGAEMMDPNPEYDPDYIRK
ncbi:MAG: sulfatase [Bacteroidia bacterium]